MSSESKDEAVAADAAAVESKTDASAQPRFQIKKWSAVTFWSWDIVLDTCAICRNSLYEPSIEHQAAGMDEVTIAWGVCNHCFHLECIQRWLRLRNVCPLCGSEWEFQKVEKIN